MKALHSLTNSCDFADLKFRLAEMRGTYHFGALSMGYVSFWRPYTNNRGYPAGTLCYLALMKGLEAAKRKRNSVAFPAAGFCAAGRVRSGVWTDFTNGAAICFAGIITLIIY